MDAEATRKIDDTTRRLYEQLVKTRHAQTTYMATVRRTNEAFASLVSPDLIPQYNYVHQSMKSYRSGMPTGACTVDGGITCSNLSVLQHERVGGGRPDVYAATLPPADGSDYLASRIIDLLDRPTDAGDHDLTMNVRDEFVANIDALNAMFEERYKVCQERGSRLHDELSTARRQLAESRTTATRTEPDKAVRRMREQIARYESQLRTVRQQLETFQEMDENSIQRNRREVEELVARANLLHGRGRTDVGEAFSHVLQKLFDTLETEHDRVLTALHRIQIAHHEKRSSDLSRLAEGAKIGEAAAASEVTADELERRVQAEVAERVRNEMATRHQERESRIEAEVDRRMQTKEDELRAEANKTFGDRISVLARQLAEEVDKRAAEMFEALSPADRGALLGALEADAGGKFKRTLEGISRLRESALDVHPMRSTGSGNDEVTVNEYYDYFAYLLNKFRDMYKFAIVQLGYVSSIGNTAFREFAPKDVRVKRRDEFKNKIHSFMQKHASQVASVQKRLLKLLEDTHRKLTSLKSDFEKFYRAQSFYETRDRTDGAAARAVRNRERDEMERLRLQRWRNRRRLKELQMIVDGQCTREGVFSPAFGEAGSMTYVAKSRLGYYLKKREEIHRSVRDIYNELATFVVDVVTGYQRWCAEQGKKPPNPLLSYERKLDEIFTVADREIDYGQSPQTAWTLLG